MDFVAMIASAHPYLDRFDYDHYPDCFSAFEENCARWFTEHEALDAEGETERILEQFEARWEQLPRRERREAAYRDKQVLALFFSPAGASGFRGGGRFRGNHAGKMEHPLPEKHLSPRPI